MTRARDLADSADKDIAGTLTLDGLTVETDNASIVFTGTTGNNFITAKQGLRIDIDSDNNQGATSFGVTRDGGLGNVLNANENGDVTLYASDGSTAKFFWDASSENLGIGTTSPSGTAHVFSGASGAAASADFIVEDAANVQIMLACPSANQGIISFADPASNNSGRIRYLHTDDSMRFDTNQTEAMRISSSGSVGIGTTSPAAELHVNSGLDNLAGLFESTDSGATITLIDNSTTGGSAAEHGLNTVGNELEIRATSNLSFETAGTERCRVDATGVSVTSGTLTTPSVTTNEIRGNSNIVSYHADYDASSSGNQGHLFFANNSDNSYGGFFNNDFYIQDNLSVGRYYRADGTNEYNTDGTSAVTVYSSDSTTGPATYKNYTQLVSRNSTDPDYGLVMATSANVESETLDTTESDQMAFVLDNGGRIWAWSSHYAGRTRRGDSTTTTNYRVGDHGFTGYSNTGGTHGESSYNGFTQISGRETPNSDNVFRVSVAGSDRIHFYANGNGYFDGGADLGNADYAEYFEWADGNPDNEDRRGYSVVVTTDGKMRIATSEDDTADFLGIVSVHAAICGDAAPMSWQGKYQLDKFGGRVLVDINHTCWMDKPDGEYNDSDQWDHKYTDEYISSNNIAVPDYAKVITTQVPVESDGYEQDREYIPRKDRKEWQAIGLMGKLPLLKGQPTAPQWRKLFDLNDEVEMWLVR